MGFLIHFAIFMPLTGVEPVTPRQAASSFPKGALPLWRSPPKTWRVTVTPTTWGKSVFSPPPFLVRLKCLLLSIYMPLTGVEPVPLAPEASALSIALQGH